MAATTTKLEGHYPLVMTRGDVMSALGIGRHAYYHLVEEGNLPVLKMSRQWNRHRRSDVEALLMKEK